jgi:plasmid stabilization system protein ParE
LTSLFPAFVSVRVRFHRSVQTDLDEILERYREFSDSLAEEFFTEFQTGLFKVAENPRFFHFDTCGLRRCNFDRFPYHFLYDVREDYVRVWVVRHNRRNPTWGVKRF